MYVDPVMPEVTHFCLPGLLPLLKTDPLAHSMRLAIHTKCE